MRSIEAAAALALLTSLAAAAQPQAQGFAVERLYRSPPGSGWLVMDDLDWREGLNGAVDLTLGYAHHAYAPAGLPVVAHDLRAEIALMVGYDRFRLSASFASPVYLAGQGGSAVGIDFAPPVANLEETPDVVGDVHVDLSAALFGGRGDPLRVGAGAALIFPSGNRSDYLTDDSYRAIARVLFAGDAGPIAYAGHLGVHLRRLDDAQDPGAPRGSELLFGAAASARFAAGSGAIAIGPEIFGGSPLRSFSNSALEAMLSARYEARSGDHARVGVKAGIGAGLGRDLGAPAWRALVGIELRGFLDAAQPR